MALVLEESSMPVILCCLCGVEIQQNAANMCVTCLRNSVDITEGINRQLTIHSCRSCGRYVTRIVSKSIVDKFCPDFLLLLGSLCSWSPKS